MKKKTQYLLIIVFITLVCVGVWISTKKKQVVPLTPTMHEVETTPSLPQESPLPNTPHNEKKEKTSETISLEVLGKKYTTSWKEGLTVIEAMNSIQKNNPALFSFTTQQFSSLGEFVYMINGTQESPGKYWLYYVNGTQASVGISKYVLHVGDHIVWKQE